MTKNKRYDLIYVSADIDTFIFNNIFNIMRKNHTNKKEDNTMKKSSQIKKNNLEPLEILEHNWTTIDIPMHTTTTINLTEQQSNETTDQDDFCEFDYLLKYEDETLWLIPQDTYPVEAMMFAKTRVFSEFCCYVYYYNKHNNTFYIDDVTYCKTPWRPSVTNVVEHIATSLYMNARNYLPKKHPKFVYFYQPYPDSKTIVRQEVNLVPVYKNKKFIKYNKPNWNKPWDWTVLWPI